MTGELRRLLREQAESHRPDRARMLARVERGTARRSPGPRPRSRTRVLSWPKVALATLATAGTLTVSALVAVTFVHTPDPAHHPAAAAPTAPGGATAPGRATPSPSPAAGSRTEDGPLWSDGSVDPHSNRYWAQSNVTFKARDTLTALVVELRIALTEGVVDTGSWRTLPAADFDLSVREERGFLVYRWTLKPGRTVPAGEHVFAGQYDHATGGRDAKDDAYRIEAATGTAKERAAVWGDFA